MSRQLVGRSADLLATALIIAAIAVIDRRTGLEVRVYPLYYLPIAYAAYRLPLTWAALAPLAATAAWVWSNVPLVPGSVSGVSVFNALAQALAFIVMSALLIELRRRLLRERLLSRRDFLTGLANRQAFYEEGESLIANSGRARRPVTLAYLDLDNFKCVNDSRGHLEGDRLLQAMAAVLTEQVRRGDLVARLGGDEFALVLPNCDEEGATRLLTRIRSAARTQMQSAGWPVSLSVGAVTYDSAPESLRDATQAADTLMYQVKQSGKDSFRIQRVADAQASPLANTGTAG